MASKFLSRKGQNMAEYAIIFGVVIAAAVGISALIKEGIQDRVAREVSKLGETNATAGTATFDITSTQNRTSNVRESTNVALGGAVNEVRGANVTVNASEGYRAGN